MMYDNARLLATAQLTAVSSPWCKGTHRGIGRRELAVCGAKPSHHSLQNLRVKTPLFMPLHHEMTSEAAKKKGKKITSEASS